MQIKNKTSCGWQGKQRAPIPALCSPGPPATVLGRLPRKGFRAEPHAYVLTLLSSGRAVSTPGCFSVCGPPPPELALGSAGLSWDQCLGTAAPLC